MEFWLATARDLGVAVTCLAGLSFAVYRAIMWLAINVIKPMADRHIKFLDDLTLAHKAQGITLEMLAHHQGKSMERLEAALERLEEVFRTLSEVKSQVARMDIHSEKVIVHTSKAAGSSETMGGP